jgi:Double zinc ribbon
MSFAIFGISNSGLNLVVSLFVLALVVVWLALIVYTYLDAKRRISDSFLVACATVASFFPYIGTAVYAIVRPPEFLEDAHERELEVRAAELRVRQLTEQSCPNCEYPVEKTFLRCPNCQRRLKDPCPSCSKPVDPRWALCPYCETELQRRAKRPQGARRKQSSRAPAGGKDSERPMTKKEPATRVASREASKPKRQQRSTEREPDPDPRQA